MVEPATVTAPPLPAPTPAVIVAAAVAPPAARTSAPVDNAKKAVTPVTPPATPNASRVASLAAPPPAATKVVAPPGPAAKELVASANGLLTLLNDESALAAAEQCDVAALKEVLTPLNVNAADERGRTALYWAIAHDRVDLLRVVLSVPGVRIADDLVGSGISPLQFAIEKRASEPLVRALLDHGAPVSGVRCVLPAWIQAYSITPAKSTVANPTDQPQRRVVKTPVSPPLVSPQTSQWLALGLAASAGMGGIAFIGLRDLRVWLLVALSVMALVARKLMLQ